MERVGHIGTSLYPSLLGEGGDAAPRAMTPCRVIMNPTIRMLTPSPPRMLVGVRIDTLVLILSSCKKVVIAPRVIRVNTKSYYNHHHLAGPEFRIFGMNRGWFG